MRPGRWRSWLATGIFWIGCAHANSNIPAGAAVAMSTLADQVVQGIERQGKVLASPEVLVLAQTQVAELFPQAQFTVIFVDDPTPNARAFPNGAVLVNSGLALDLDHPSDWEFVLAHEVAHLALGHLEQQLENPTASERAQWEQAADRMALERMIEAERDVSSIAALLLRTRKNEAHRLLAALPDLNQSRSADALNPAIAKAQTFALEQVLAVNQIDRAKAFLARELPWLKPDDVRRWEWMVRQRTGVIDNPERPLHLAMPQSVAQGFPSHSGSCAEATFQPTSAPLTGKTTRFGSTVFTRDPNWRIALQTGRQLTLTPDRSAISRLDIWTVNRTPTGSETLALPCPNTRLALWHALSEFRGIGPQRKLILDGARPLVDGIEVNFTMVDETGLRWHLRGWRRVVGEQTVYALFKAPAQHFFPRHSLVADKTIAGLLSPN